MVEGDIALPWRDRPAPAPLGAEHCCAVDLPGLREGGSGSQRLSD
jgi:hypothetical protein